MARATLRGARHDRAGAEPGRLLLPRLSGRGGAGARPRPGCLWQLRRHHGGPGVARAVGPAGGACGGRQAAGRIRGSRQRRCSGARSPSICSCTCCCSPRCGSLAPWLAVLVRHRRWRLAVPDRRARPAALWLYATLQAIHQGRHRFVRISVVEIVYALTKLLGVLGDRLPGHRVGEGIRGQRAGHVLGVAFLLPRTRFWSKDELAGLRPPHRLMAAPIGLLSLCAAAHQQPRSVDLADHADRRAGSHGRHLSGRSEHRSGARVRAFRRRRRAAAVGVPGQRPQRSSARRGTTSSRRCASSSCLSAGPASCSPRRTRT